MLPDFSYSMGRRYCVALVLILALSGCATKKTEEDVTKYRSDIPEVMSEPYTPRDDGLPLTAVELQAFKTVGFLDRQISAEEARIVELHFKYFVHQNRRTFQRFLDRSYRFLPYIKEQFNARGIPEEISYLCMVESGGNPNARSHAGAAGLWQFMPFTGKKYGLTQNNWIDERRDPYKATLAAADYLLKLHNDFSNWHLAVAAYNAGEGKIGRAITGTGAKDFFELCRLDNQLEERARLRDETRDYVPRLIAMAKIMRNLKRLGFTEPTPDKAWNLNPMNIPAGTNLAGLAKHLGLTWDEFSGMNPAFRRTASPPNAKSTAYIPPAQMVAAVTWVASPEARTFAGWKEYKVRKGDSLAGIAKRHKIGIAALKQANGFAKLPKPGSTILIPGKGNVEPVYDAQATAASSPTASAGTYTVRAGDTLFGLAQQWSTDVNSIRLANRMGSKDTSLKPGQRISIPGNAKKRSPAQPAQSSSSSKTYYTVKAGDTPLGIARSHAVTLDALCEANNINRAKPAIRKGQRLLIPGKSTTNKQPIPSKSSATGNAAKKTNAVKSKTVTVKSGDSLYGIARANSVSVQALQKANKLGSSTKLKIGQKLLIP